MYSLNTPDGLFFFGISNISVQFDSNQSLLFKQELSFLYQTLIQTKHSLLSNSQISDVLI
jgi:hypothetical protein